MHGNGPFDARNVVIDGAIQNFGMIVGFGDHESGGAATVKIKCIKCS